MMLTSAVKIERTPQTALDPALEAASIRMVVS
jgi:hypothetical protein